MLPLMPIMKQAVIIKAKQRGIWAERDAIFFVCFFSPFLALKFNNMFWLWGIFAIVALTNKTGWCNN